MPIEVPDTRGFRRREPAGRPAAALPVPGISAELTAELSAEIAAPAQRRRKASAAAPLAAAAEAAVEPLTGGPAPSAFNRPVRRRPRADTAPAAEESATAAVEPAAVEPAAVEPAAVEPAAVEPPPVNRTALPARTTDRVEAETSDVVVVRLGGTRYAVPMDSVAEVGRPPHVTRVPGVPSWVSGVANWRGRVLPVIDLRLLLGAPALDLGVTGRIVVVTRDGVSVALLAERVEGVVTVSMDRLEPVLVTVSRIAGAILAGQLTHPDGPVAVLDMDRLFGLRSQLPAVRRAG